MDEINIETLAKATGFNQTTLRRWSVGESGEGKKKLFNFMWVNRRKYVNFCKRKKEE